MTHVESALLELELIGVDQAIGDKAQALLTSRLLALGANVPVTVSKEKEVVKLRAVLSGPRAADLVYQLETQVSQSIYDLICDCFIYFSLYTIGYS